ncbi:MAG: hypothetical protein HN653_00645 [Candidatus Marinimicrobia bacterium]|jgi:hypothetical protein|nr:hypothetical protein [Candidatus Neomarinimicrobiota bacterium]
MYEAFEHLTDLYLSEFIVAILIISIIVVVMSIFHIVMTPTDSKPEISRKIKPTKKPSKEPKIQYSKEFLKRVKGVDLDLKDQHK